MEASTGVQRLVVKVGSRILTGDDGDLNPQSLRQLVKQLAECSGNQRRIVLVSSGAIACGMGILGFRRRPTALAQLQACAAVGQSHLMHKYARAFAKYGLNTAQVLLTQDDLADKRRFENAKQTLLALLHRNIIPIVNENDTVAVDELTFGDNDRLAALVACAVDAQLLILLSDVDGLLKEGQLIQRVDRLSEEHFACVRETKTSTGKGGMSSKLEAARIAGHQGIPLVIANGLRRNVIPAILAGEPVGTLIVPPQNKLGRRRWWIAYSLRNIHGQIVVDDGAAGALSERGKSLLASGVCEVRGSFKQGDCVSVISQSEQEIARGVTNYSAAELKRAKGLQSTAIAEALGWDSVPEVVHRDRMVLVSRLKT